MDTLSQHVTDTLRAWVLQGIVSPGERLEEIPLAAKLGVSRTPVRAALSNLGNEGLMEHQHKLVNSVRGFKFEQIVGAYDVRAVLEGRECRKSVQTVHRDFSPIKTKTT